MDLTLRHYPVDGAETAGRENRIATPVAYPARGAPKWGAPWLVPGRLVSAALSPTASSRAGSSAGWSPGRRSPG